MSAVCITCDSCRRSWTLSFEDSAPFAVDIASRPCPYCEAYTLGCHAPLRTPATSGPPRRLRPRQRATPQGRP
jgi:hypothetical protein